MKYENNWESLDRRPMPEWFLDSKFGAFIMWGEYSVPAYAVKNGYSEWYEFNLKSNEEIIKRETTGHLFLENNQNTKLTPEIVRQGFREDSKFIKDFHYKTYGKDFIFENFFNMFKGELFNPDEWADIFF